MQVYIVVAWGNSLGIRLIADDEHPRLDELDRRPCSAYVEDVVRHLPFPERSAEESDDESANGQ